LRFRREAAQDAVKLFIQVPSSQLILFTIQMKKWNARQGLQP